MHLNNEKSCNYAITILRPFVSSPFQANGGKNSLFLESPRGHDCSFLRCKEKQVVNFRHCLLQTCDFCLALAPWADSYPFETAATEGKGSLTGVQNCHSVNF